MKKIIAIMIMALAIIPTQVIADGIIIEPYIDSWRMLDETSQLAAINYEDGIERMIISVNFNMKDADEALWIFPVPAVPEDVTIDVVDQFPYMYGYNIVEKSEYEIDNIMNSIMATQLYPMLFSQNSYYQLYSAVTRTATLGDYEETADGVNVYEHLEKHGMTTEIITATSGSALYNYLSGKGLNIEEGSIDVLNDYIGEDYTFVASWITPPEDEDKTYCEEGDRDSDECYFLYDPVCGSDGKTYSNDCIACSDEDVEWYVDGECNSYKYYRNPGIFLSFPTEDMYFPLMPTSAYGSKVIPITLYVMGHVTPEFSEKVDPYTRTGYYIQNRLYIEGLVNFFGDMDLNNVPYTKIEIESPSKYFTEDLWISNSAPSNIGYANMIYSVVTNNYTLLALFILMILSAASGAISGMIVFKDYKRYALLGLFNVFSILGLAAAVAFTKTKKVDDRLKRRLQREGFMVISSDKRKLYFIVAFSITMLILCVITGYLIKLPLGI